MNIDMSDAERIAELEKKVVQLEAGLRDLMVGNLRLINLHRAVMSKNSLKSDIKLSERDVDAWEQYGEIFDEIMARVRALS